MRKFPHNGRIAVLTTDIHTGDGFLIRVPAGTRVRLGAATNQPDNSNIEYWIGVLGEIDPKVKAYAAIYGIGVSSSDFTVLD